MYDDVSFFGVGYYLYRLHRSLALAGAIPGVYIHVKRPKAERTVIARGVAERLYLLAAVGANKPVIIF